MKENRSTASDFRPIFDKLSNQRLVSIKATVDLLSLFQTQFYCLFHFIFFPFCWCDMNKHSSALNASALDIQKSP